MIVANVGHTTIEATGAPQDLAALFGHIRATARGGCAFTLSGLMHPDPAPDQYVYWTELSATDQQVSLSIGIAYDLAALYVTERLAERFPALRIAAFFVAEGDDSAFDAVLHIGGQLAYHAHFDDDICFPLQSTGPNGHRSTLVRLFERTPQRSAAAPDHIDGEALAQLGTRPAVAGGWCQATRNDLGFTVWWHPSAMDDANRALVLDAYGATLLTGVDRWGGYGRKERLDAAAAAHRLPELASLIEQHARDHAERQAATCRFMAQASNLDDFEVPF